GLFWSIQLFPTIYFQLQLKTRLDNLSIPLTSAELIADYNHITDWQKDPARIYNGKKKVRIQVEIDTSQKIFIEKLL
ncbi:hypothetical protein Leryth_017123, partial [Lithospermum erythrorhizon]